jgi:hypothetical protein
MHKHRLELANDERKLRCLLPDCPIGGKPFMIAGGDVDPVVDDDLISDQRDEIKLPKIKIVGLDYEEISLCNHELPYYVVSEYIKTGTRFCQYDGEQKNIYKLPNCFACGRIIRIQLIFPKNDYRANHFCAHCGAQVLKDGKLVTA